MSHLSDLFKPGTTITSGWAFHAVVLVVAASGICLAVQMIWPQAGAAFLILCMGVGLPLALILLRTRIRLAGTQYDAQKTSQIDPLTGLLNQRSFLIRFNRALPQSGVLMICSLDHFKSANNRYSRHVGDLCLMAVAQHCREITRKTDIIGRLDGAVFAIYLPGAPVLSAQKIADELSDGIQVATEQITLNMTMSVGMVVANGWTHASALMQDAGKALDLAKLQGPARVIVSDLPLAA